MAAVAAPADKRFRRAHVKPARRRRVDLRLWWLVARIVTVLLIAIYGGWRATAMALNAPTLRVSRVQVRGNERLSTGEVLAIVQGLQGDSTLTVDLDGWRRRLLASPWVHEASLRRVLPSRVDIDIRERRPMGIARLEGVLYLVDPHGIIIDEYGPQYADLDLPIVDGLAGSPDDAGAVDETRARRAARVIEALNTRPELAARVSQIDVSDPDDAVVMLENDTALLRLGDDAFVERLQNYLDLRTALRERIAQIDYVDLRFDERLYVRPLKK